MTLTSWPYPRLIAHRGGGTEAPENTLAAMKKGRECGYQAVEFDVKLTADNVAILMHDPVLGRTAPGTGAFRDLYYDDLATLDVGSWHSPAYQQERIPRFTEVAQWLLAHHMYANVEIKPCPGRERETGHLVGGLCRDLWLGQAVQPLISSFSREALEAARKVAPELALGFLVKDFESSHYEVLDALKCVSLHCHHGAVNSAMTANLHSHGYRVMVYTVNDVNRARELMGIGVDGIFTDRLSQMSVEFPEAIHG